jgi:hypothetical protein
MYTKQISTAFPVPSTTTSAVSTTVSLASGPQIFPASQDGSAIVALSFNSAVHGTGTASLLSAPDGTTFSVALDMAGNPITVTILNPSTLTGITKFFTVKSLGQAVKLKVNITGSGGAGNLDCVIFQD